MSQSASDTLSHLRGNLSGRILRLPLFDPLAYRWSARKLRRRMDAETNRQDVLDTAYDFSGYGHYNNIGPMQIRAELSELLERLDENQVEVALEIGTSDGGTLYTLCRGVPSIDRVLSIDLPDGPYGGGYPAEKARFFDLFMEGGPTLIRGNSHDSEVKDRVREALDGREIDFLFLDGDHTYSGVKQDYEMYAPFVSEGGIIGLDDLYTHTRDYFDKTTHGVYEFWSELEAEHETEEIIDTADSRSKGIGLVHKQ